jgi:hypothetical protein
MSKRAKAYIFSMKHLLADFYQVCSNKRLKNPRVKISPLPGGIDFPYMYIVKLKKRSCENPKEVEFRYLA